VRSLADTAYTGEGCLQGALRHGATQIHGIKKNARLFKETFESGIIVDFQALAEDELIWGMLP